MGKEGDVPHSQETGVKNPVVSVIGGEKFRLQLSSDGALAVTLVTVATAACCICGGSDAAVRLGIEVVNRLIK